VSVHCKETEMQEGIRKKKNQVVSTEKLKILETFLNNTATCDVTSTASVSADYFHEKQFSRLFI